MTEEKSFADMLDESYVEPSQLEPGQKVEASVVSIGREWVFINMGGKSEGYIAVSEYIDAEGQITVNEGDSVAAFFLSAKKGGMLFTTQLAHV